MITSKKYLEKIIETRCFYCDSNFKTFDKLETCPKCKEKVYDFSIIEHLKEFEINIED